MNFEKQQVYYHQRQAHTFLSVSQILTHILIVVLLVAGSETTSTTLTAATYYLLTNPASFEKLKQEVRANFRHQHSITLLELAKQQYLNACIEEAVCSPPLSLDINNIHHNCSSFASSLPRHFPSPESSPPQETQSAIAGFQPA
jgi:hypothetical protein